MPTFAYAWSPCRHRELTLYSPRFAARYGVTVITGLAGFIPGYIAGVFGGIYAQYLGWMASLLDIIALAAIAGMTVLDIVMLWI